MNTILLPLQRMRNIDGTVPALRDFLHKKRYRHGCVSPVVAALLFVQLTSEMFVEGFPSRKNCENASVIIKCAASTRRFQCWVVGRLKHRADSGNLGNTVQFAINFSVATVDELGIMRAGRLPPLRGLSMKQHVV